MIGCGNSATVVIADVGGRFAASLPLTATACFEATCTAARVDRGTSSPTCEVIDSSPGNTQAPQLVCVPQPPDALILVHPLGEGAGLKEGTPYSISLRLVDRFGHTLLDRRQAPAISARQPNGAGCGPTCLSAGATF